MNHPKIYDTNQLNTLYTHHLLVFNSTETTRSKYNYIFYFVDNAITGTEVTLFLFQPLMAYQNFGARRVLRAHQILSKPIDNNCC